MKIIRNQLNQSGSTLLLTLVATIIIGGTLAAYLTLVKSQHQVGMRSQAWNATIPVIEAGMEEALTHLNTHGTTNLLCDGWSLIDGQYVMQRSVGDNYYNVCIYNWVAGASNQTPIIESRGFVNTPILVASADNLAMFAASQTALPSGFLGRGVRAASRQDFMFTKALVAKGKIDLKGNNVRTDSFDSSDPTASNGGAYDPTKAKANGDVATDDTVTNSVSVANADVYGHVSTGPRGTVSIGPNGSVGDATWHDPQTANNVKGIQPGSVKDDMNVDFPDARVPFSGGYLPYLPAGTNGYTYNVPSGNYQISSLALSGTDILYVSGDAVIYVTGDVSLSGSASIEIASGAHLRLFVGGAGDLGGNSVVNHNNDAATFLYEGLVTSTTLSVSGNAQFVGCIYAPNADVTFNGSGNTPYDFVGAGVFKTISMNGHFNFHYDEALRKTGPFRGFVLTSWNEMTPNEVGTYSTP